MRTNGIFSVVYNKGEMTKMASGINKYVRTARKAESEEERKRRQPEAIAIC